VTIWLSITAFVLVLVVAAALVMWSRRRGSVSVDEVPGAEPRPQAGVPSAGPRARGDGLGTRIRAAFRGGAGDDAWGNLEDALIKADVGPSTSSRIVGDVKARWTDGDDPVVLVRDEVLEVLGDERALDLPGDRLAIVMVVGVNGAGKTTTIGKLASWLGAQGKSVSLANSDTFRAAAAEQLDVWAQRSGAHLVAQSRGADPGSVAFDAVKSAEARGSSVLIVDTAGRLHTKEPLMEELKKVRRVIEKAAGRPPDETLLVLDATTGQNGIAQARAFTEAAEVTGVALTKLDGTAKGGVVLAVREELGVPVKVVGTGETLGDLEPFDPRAFADGLLGE
jgi:fused signal recognition particle receptor